MSDRRRGGDGQFLLWGVLTMKTDLTSNHLKMPGNLYAVVYMVLSIHIFCKGNTHRTLVRRRMLQVDDSFCPRGDLQGSGRQGHQPPREHLTGHALLNCQTVTQDTVAPCSLANGAHFPGIWPRKYNRRGELHTSTRGRLPLSKQTFGKAPTSFPLALLSGQKKPEDANPLRKTGLHKSDLSTF